MPPGSTWIERGPDGRPHFVRQKTKLPSTRKLLSDAFAPVRRASFPLPFSRSYQRDHSITPAQSNTPLSLPGPPAPPVPTSSLHHQQPCPFNNGAVSPNMNPYYQSNQQQSNKESDNNPRGILTPSPQSYAAPFPGMYPIPPPVPGNQTQAYRKLHLLPPYSAQHIPGQDLPFPTQPPGISQALPLPAGARVISPPRLPTADDLRYKCSICGRFRSARYHYKHPIPPGQLPGKTICRKCREEATDSEDETESAESLDYRTHHRGSRRSRSQRRGASVSVVPRRRSSRGRSQRRVIYCDEEEDGLDEPVGERSYSRSSSLEVEPRRRGSRRTTPRRRRSSSGDVIRYVERLARPKLVRTITYVDEMPRRTYEYDEDEGSGEFREHRYLRRISRPPTPAPRVIRRQYSDPFIHLTQSIASCGYLDAPPPTRRVSGATDLSRSSSRHKPAPPSDSGRDFAQSAESDGESCDRGRQYLYSSPQIRMDRSRGGSRGRSRNQSRHQDDWTGRYRHVSVLHRPSSPNQWTGSAYREVENVGRDVSVDREPGRLRSNHRRRASGSQSLALTGRASRTLLPGDEVTAVEEHPGHPSEDYDWYDKDGMRVRVREI